MEKNALIRQVESLPELIKAQYEDLEPKARKVLDTPDIFSIRRIILTGCGDSYAAAVSLRYAFQELTGIPTDVVPAIELSRNYPRELIGKRPCTPLVIAMSNSGSVVRVAEAMEAMKKHGALTLAITGKRESPLGKAADRILDLCIPSFESAPGTRSYMVAVMAMLLVAIRIGEVLGNYTMDVAMDMRLDMPNQGTELAKLLPEMEEKMEKLAIEWQKMNAYDFVGTGMDAGTALFGVAKTFEAIGKPAMRINSEEWLHMNFFMRDVNGTGTVITAMKDNPAWSRNVELVKYAVELTRPVLVISDAEQSDFGIQTNYVKVPRTKYLVNSTLTEYAPICILMGYLMILLGEEDGRGCKGVWHIADGARCIRESEKIVF
ncbi:MAG: SIS domain-containing protein [Sphaerochaetaceae bacterium]|nr:SIS domain-containing protein [Sphaerochaetaceae bacterium]